MNGPPRTLESLETPALLVDAACLDRNLTRMSSRMRQLGVDLRPHMKTAKCVEVARRATAGHSGGITVSTVAVLRDFSATVRAIALSPVCSWNLAMASWTSAPTGMFFEHCLQLSHKPHRSPAFEPMEGGAMGQSKS